VDKPDARIPEVMDEVLELLLDLNATDEQFNSPTIFCSGRQGTAAYGPDEVGVNLEPLFETIVRYIDAPQGDETAPLQLLVSSIDYNEYVGRIGIGRIERGVIRKNQDVYVCNYHSGEAPKRAKVVALFQILTRPYCEDDPRELMSAFSASPYAARPLHWSIFCCTVFNALSEMMVSSRIAAGSTRKMKLIVPIRLLSVL
jgi:hypothetical protein